MILPARALVVCLALWSAAGPAGAEQPCPSTPLTVPSPTEPIRLTEAQEVDLGDAAAEHLQRSFKVLNHESTIRLQEIGDRIVRQLPPTSLKFRFMLVDQPYWNAFALPGGRIYVTRKLVAFARTEDELAGILGHEIGHLIARHAAADLSLAFEKELGITTFGERADVFEKYRRLVDRSAGMRRSGKRLQHQQYEADQLALEAVARAGYAPRALADIWDRYHETGQKTGNFFTDLFGATRPGARRLREMIRAMRALPEGCRAARHVESEDFDAWKRRVIESTGSPIGESVKGVVLARPLSPPMRANVTHLRFSPDGRYALAQDDGAIHILSRDPFETLFTIDAQDAEPAQFTVDSNEVLFHTRGLRIERWDVAGERRIRANELVTRMPCVKTALSPDGRALACLSAWLDLVLLNTETGAELFSKQRAYHFNYAALAGALRSSSDLRMLFDVFQLAFTPDSSCFIVGHPAGETTVDLSTGKPPKWPAATRRALRGKFAFIGGDRLVTVDAREPERSAILRFPSGELLTTVTLGGAVSAATRGEAVLLRPLKDYPVGLVDLTSGRLVLASRHGAFDAYDGLRLSLQPNGDVALFSTDSQRPIATTTLTGARLGRLSAHDVSADLRWIAMSNEDRGGIWNVETGSRMAHVRGFRGAYIAPDGRVYADFPKHTQLRNGTPVEHERAIVRMELGSDRQEKHAVIPEDHVALDRRYLSALRAARPDQWDRDVTVELRDVASNALLWSRRFPSEVPWQYWDTDNDRLILEWPVSSDAARQAIRSHPRLAQAAASNKLKGGDAYVEVIDLADGEVLGRILVNTGRETYRIQHALSAGDSLVIADRLSQISVYSLTTGESRGGTFGRFAAVSEKAGLLCVQNDTGELDVFDLATMQHRAELRLSSGIRLARFSGDGRRLLLVTADQMARVFETSVLGGAADRAAE